MAAKPICPPQSTKNHEVPTGGLGLIGPHSQTSTNSTPSAKIVYPAMPTKQLQLRWSRVHGSPVPTEKPTPLDRIFSPDAPDCSSLSVPSSRRVLELGVPNV